VSGIEKGENIKEGHEWIISAEDEYYDLRALVVMQLVRKKPLTQVILLKETANSR